MYPKRIIFQYLQILFILACFLSAAPVLQAQNTDRNDTATKEEKEGDKKAAAAIVVTETKIPQNVKNATQKATIISEKEIGEKVTTKNNLSELLGDQPGSAVSALSRNDANWGSYGGLGPKYNVYLLDGLPIDSFVDTMSLDSEIIERIEAFRGPASVMYTNYLSQDFAGNQSPLSGITNIVLKDKIDKPVTKVSAAYGSWNTQKYHAFHQGSTGSFNYFFGGDYEKSDYTDYGTSDSWLNIVDNPQYQKTKLFGKVGYNITQDQKVSVFANHTQHSGDAGRVNRDYNHTYDMVNADYFNQINADLSLLVKGGYRRYDRRAGEDNYPTSFDLASHNGVRQNICPVDITVNYKHLGESYLTAGLDNQYGDYYTYSDAPYRISKNEATANNTGLYAQEKLVLFDNLILRAGLRYNHTQHWYEKIDGGEPGEDGNSWDALIWNAGVKWNALDTLSVYANAGSSYLTPGIKSIAGTIKSDDTTHSGQLPNPDLKPEAGYSVDLGTDIQALDDPSVLSLSLGLRGYATFLEDSIVDNVVNASPSQTKSINAGKASIFGGEFETKLTTLDVVGMFANYTYAYTEIENSKDESQDGARVPFVPFHTVNAGLSVDMINNFFAALYLHYSSYIYDSTSKTGRSRLDGYAVLNAKLQKSIMMAGGYRINLGVDLVNITDNRYEMPWAFQDPGFAAFGKVELVF